MNEKEFKKHILKLVKDDDRIMDYYELMITGSPFDVTLQRLAVSVDQKYLTLEQLIILSLFIGMSTP